MTALEAAGFGLALAPLLLPDSAIDPDAEQISDWLLAEAGA
jgi:hypothetical protein